MTVPTTAVFNGGSTTYSNGSTELFTIGGMIPVRDNNAADFKNNNPDDPGPVTIAKDSQGDGWEVYTDRLTGITAFIADLINPSLNSDFTSAFTGNSASWIIGDYTEHAWTDAGAVANAILEQQGNKAQDGPANASNEANKFNQTI